MLTLTQPIKFGALTLPNRIVMSPMTRNRSPMEVPTALNAQYYAQRATAGLIISEATAISLEGLGWGGTPGIFTPEQVAGWHHVVNEVHAAGGRIFSQMWHCGACSHPSTRRGALPLSASPLRLGGTVRTPLGRLPMVGTSEPDSETHAASSGYLPVKLAAMKLPVIVKNM
jgi:N-ethylmaleimide reductase